MAKSKEVDAWFASYENPMKAVVQRIRDIILAADPRIDECIKWQAPTFTYKGNLASFFPKSKQHASLMFHDGANIPGEHPILEGTSDKGRSLKCASIADADKAKRVIVKLVKAWCDWRDEADGPPHAAPAKKRARALAKKGAAARTPAKKGAGVEAKKAAGAPTKKVAAPASQGTKRGYDEAVAQRIREVLGPTRDVLERKMFGGLCFMVDGKMCCGLTKDSFMARVGKDGYADALAQPHVKPMTFTGRPLAGFVYVEPAGYATKAALTKWVERGLRAEAPAANSKKRRGSKPAPTSR